MQHVIVPLLCALLLTAGPAEVEDPGLNILPAERRIPWQPGVGAFPAKTFIRDVTAFGANGSDSSDDTAAFTSAIAAFPPSGGQLTLPAGTYHLNKTLNITSGILIKGAGSTSTQLHFNLAGRAEHCIKFSRYGAGSWHPIVSGHGKGSNRITLASTAEFRPGNYIEIQQENDPANMYTKPDWNVSWAQNAVGQIMQVSAVENGTSLVLSRPLYFTYSQSLHPQVRTIDMLEYPGLEDLAIERADDGDGNTITMVHAAHARIQRVESSNTVKTHLYLSGSYAGEIRRCYFHHSHDYGGGGHGYGVELLAHTSDCLVIDTIFATLRHSMMTHVGSCGNVFAYNFSTNRQGQCDISLHGHYSYANLFESNVAEEISTGDWWGPSGPFNTFLRNRVTQADMNVMDASHQQNLLGNILDKGEVIIDAGIDTSFVHGNVIADTVQWRVGTGHQLPRSLFLDTQPDFFSAVPWPLFGPDVSTGNVLPAQKRYQDNRPIEP